MISASMTISVLGAMAARNSSALVTVTATFSPAGTVSPGSMPFMVSSVMVLPSGSTAPQPFSNHWGIRQSSKVLPSRVTKLPKVPKALVFTQLSRKTLFFSIT